MLKARIDSTYRLAALIVAVLDALSRVTRLIQELSLSDQAPELVRAAVGLRVATVVGWRVVVPAGALEAVRGVEARVHVERGRVVGVDGGGGVDAEAVAVGGDAHDDLVGRHTGCQPGIDAEFTGALVVAGVAGGAKWGVGTGGGRPGAVDVVVLCRKFG